MEILYFIGIYLIGFFITLTFLKFFGKLIGGDYDSRDEFWPDDFQSNAEAYMVLSTFWFVTIPLGIIVKSYMLLEKFSKWYLNL